MTCRQLREMLKIPPGFLSNTNGKRLKDTDIVEDLKVNLSDIGWYEHSYGEFEASSIRVRRNHGEYWAGYNSAISNDEIKQIYFQNKKLPDRKVELFYVRRKLNEYTGELEYFGFDKDGNDYVISENEIIIEEVE